MIIFTKEALSEMTSEQLKNLAKYYGIDARHSKSKLVELLFPKVNPPDPSPFPSDVPADEQDNKSVRVRMIERNNKI